MIEQQLFEEAKGIAQHFILPALIEAEKAHPEVSALHQILACLTVGIRTAQVFCPAEREVLKDAITQDFSIIFDRLYPPPPEYAGNVISFEKYRKRKPQVEGLR